MMCINKIKQSYFAWSDCQQVMFPETVASRMHINTCELSRHEQKSAIGHLKSSITHINFIKTISTTIEFQLD